MITLKSPHEIELMRRAGKITAAARAYAGELVKPGVTTHEIDRAVEHFIRKQGAVPSLANLIPSKKLCLVTSIRSCASGEILPQGKVAAQSP